MSIFSDIYKTPAAIFFVFIRKTLKYNKIRCLSSITVYNNTKNTKPAFRKWMIALKIFNPNLNIRLEKSNEKEIYLFCCSSDPFLITIFGRSENVAALTRRKVAIAITRFIRRSFVWSRNRSSSLNL